MVAVYHETSLAWGGWMTEQYREDRRRPVGLLILAVIVLLILLAILLRACTDNGTDPIVQPTTTPSTNPSAATTSSTAAPTTATTQTPTTTRARSRTTRPSSSLAYTDPSAPQWWMAVGAVGLIALGGLLLLRLHPGGDALGDGPEPLPSSSRSWPRSTLTAHRIGRRHRRRQARQGPPAD
jgi:hypothetical protein